MDPATAIYMWLWFSYGFSDTSLHFWIPYSMPYATMDACNTGMNEYLQEFSESTLHRQAECGVEPPKDTSVNGGMTLWGYAPAGEDPAKSKWYWAAVGTLTDKSSCEAALQSLQGLGGIGAPAMPAPHLKCNNNQPSGDPRVDDPTK